MQSWQTQKLTIWPSRRTDGCIRHTHTHTNRGTHAHTDYLCVRVQRSIFLKFSTVIISSQGFNTNKL